MKNKMLDEIQNMLNGIVGEESTKNILDNMFQEPIKGYKKGKILTVKELKALPKNSTIHLWYKDEDGHLRNNGFVKFCGYEGDNELHSTDGFTMPIDGLKESNLLERIDNSGWLFTVCEAI